MGNLAVRRDDAPGSIFCIQGIQGGNVLQLPRRLVHDHPHIDILLVAVPRNAQQDVCIRMFFLLGVRFIDDDGLL